MKYKMIVVISYLVELMKISRKQFLICYKLFSYVLRNSLRKLMTVDKIKKSQSKHAYTIVRNCYRLG